MPTDTAIDATLANETERRPEALVSPGVKHSERIARILEREIVAMGWPVGQPLGSEEEIVRRFDVSRWVVREAIAITERDGLTQRRRGRNGGLVVAAPAEVVIASAIRNYLLFVGTSGKQVFEAIAALDGLALRLAAAHRTGGDATLLRELLAQPLQRTAAEVLKQTLRENRQLLKLTRNLVLQAFGVAVSQLFVAYGAYRSLPLFEDRNGHESVVLVAARLRRRQIEHVLADDATCAIKLDRELASVWSGAIRTADEASGVISRTLTRRMAQRIVEQISALEDGPRLVKRAETLALQIHYAIMAEGLKPDDRLASEAELAARYGVGRGVLREATRYLERHALVCAEEGRHGGLRVAAAKPDATIRSSLLYLKFLKPPADDVLGVLRALQDACIDKVARRVAGHGPGCLEALSTHLLAGADASPVNVRAIGITFSNDLALAAQNPIFELFVRILCELFTVGSGVSANRVADSTTRVFVERLGNLVGALRRGDARAAHAAMMKVRETGVALEIRERDIEDIVLRDIP